MRTNQLSFFSYNWNFAESYYLTPPILFTMQVTVVANFFRACVKRMKNVIGMPFVHSSASFPLTARMSSTRCRSERNVDRGRNGRYFDWRRRRGASGRTFWPRQPGPHGRYFDWRRRRGASGRAFWPRQPGPRWWDYFPFHVSYSRLMFGFDFREQHYRYGGELLQYIRGLSWSQSLTGTQSVSKFVPSSGGRLLTFIFFIHFIFCFVHCWIINSHLRD